MPSRFINLRVGPTLICVEKQDAASSAAFEEFATNSLPGYPFVRVGIGIGGPPLKLGPLRVRKGKRVRPGVGLTRNTIPYVLNELQPLRDREGIVVDGWQAHILDMVGGGPASMEVNAEISFVDHFFERLRPEATSSPAAPR